MCASINSFAVFILLFVSLHLVLLADGLPLLRRERGTEDDIIAGKDFLQVLMDLPAVVNAEATTSHPPTLSVTLPTSIQLEHYSETLAPILRQTRSTRFTSSIQKPSSSNAALAPTQPIGDIISTLTPKRSSDLSDRRLVSVSISSSAEERHRVYSTKTSSTTEVVKITTTAANSDFANAFFSVEDSQGFVAAAKKHEFSVEESEPITKDAEPPVAEELPANVQSIPVIKKLSDFEKTSELLKELSQEKLKDKLPPFHHTVIYHNNPNEQMAARSISYSTVIQTVPGESVIRRWKGRTNKPEDAKPTQNSMSEYSQQEYDDSLEKNKENPDWETSERTTDSHMEQTESNWGMQQNAYTPKQSVPPLAYGQSEENYEVDEAVSVQTNGRIHGVQPSQSTEEQKPTANSKNGYVIEGRKERRYRVEERTPDGFIVGEFGILNRDDGLLRGVRYTAEETINPKLIYDTLMKFLSL